MTVASEGLRGRVLVVDDERNIRRTLRMLLEGEGAEVEDAGTGEDALERLQTEPAIHAVLMDVLLPGKSGLEVLEELCLATGRPPVPIIMISGHASVEDAVRATRLGAFDFFEKPLERDRVLVGVRNALARFESEREIARLRARVHGEIVGESDGLRSLLEQVAKVAPTRARVLITGESGTGKELVARAIHLQSERHAAPFVKVNCAAIPRELIESELFGHEKGSFTGATAQKKGLFEVADTGTIFLDEIGDMAQGAQAKVLRILQSGELMRVGGQRPIHVDVRVLAATHRDLPQLIESGEFREDLYFRLNVVPIQVPPLRERVGDIPLLCRRFIDESCEQNGFAPKTIAPEAVAMLQRYPWPGNIRELRNTIERMVILSDDDITLDDVPAEIRGEAQAAAPESLLDFGATAAPEGLSLRAFREAVERAFILQRLNELDWNVSRTAESLGVERTHLHKKMKVLGIQRGGT